MNIKHLFGLGLVAGSIFYFAPTVEAQTGNQSDKTGVTPTPTIVNITTGVSVVIPSNASLTSISGQSTIFVTTQTSILLITSGLGGFLGTPTNFSGLSPTLIQVINTVSATAPGPNASIATSTLVQFGGSGTGAGNFFVSIINSIFASRAGINNGTLVANAGNSILLAQEDAELEAKIKALPENVVANAAILAQALEGIAANNQVKASNLLIAVRAYNELLRSLDAAKLPLDPPEVKQIGSVLASLIQEAKTASKSIP